MIASFMTYLLVASVLLAMGGWGVETLLRALRLPTRFVWMAVLLGTTVLAMAAPLRMRNAENMRPTEAASLDLRVMEGVVVSDLPAWNSVWSSISTIREGVRAALELPITLVGQFEGERGGVILGIVWGSLSLLLLVIGGATALRYSKARKSWPLEEVEGIRVRVAPRSGPAVMGFIRPEIVVPRWLLASTPEERRLAVLHESEHLRAGDGLLLGAGCAAVALLPWNPLAWWMLSRLRIAIEVDCDARVLRHGIEQRFYGAMLIDVSGHGSGLSLGALALAGSPSTLERRLRAMTMKRSAGTLLRGSVVGSLGMIAVLAACDASMPTSEEIQAMGAEEVEEELQVMGLLDAPQDLSYFRDGVAISREEALGINSGEIVEIRVTRSQEEPEYAEVRIFTAESVPITNVPEDGSLAEVTVVGYGERPTAQSVNVDASDLTEIEVVGYRIRPTPAQDVAATDLTEVEVVGYRIQEIPAQEVEVAGVRVQPAGAPLQIRDLGEPLFLINNVPATAADFNRLNPSNIESVSVLKDESAVAYGPRAANGVILVVTKDAQSR